MNNYSMKYLIEGLIGHRARTQAEPRNEIWASDLGKPHIDTYLTMKGVMPTNPADGKGLVTFFLGNQIESGVASLLKMCGIAFEGQERLVIKNEGCLDVVGRPDFIVEVDDWNNIRRKVKAENFLKKEETTEKKYQIRLDDQLEAHLEAISAFEMKYPNGLPKTVFECKSINTQALKWGRSEGLANKYPHHVLQLYTYLIGLNLQEGHIIYIGKDYGFYSKHDVDYHNKQHCNKHFPLLPFLKYNFHHTIYKF